MKEAVRKNNLDLLRCFALAGVFFLHMQRNNAFHHYLASWGTISVSLFIMLSGALVLTSETFPGYILWIKKTFFKLIVPWILSLILYIGEGLFFRFLYYREINVNDELIFLINTGYPERGWHLWFMPIFICLYLLAPVLKRIKEYNKIIYYGTAFVLYILFMCFDVSLPWWLEFISKINLYIMGDFCYTFLSNLQLNAKRAVKIVYFCLAAFLFLFCYLDFYDTTFNKTFLSVTLNLLLYISFIFYCNINVNLNTYCITKYFLWIYILHIFVGDFWSAVSIRTGWDKRLDFWAIIVDSIIVFVTAYLICIIGNVIYIKMSKYLKKA